MTTTKRITNFSVSWQADHEQYWQGHGTAFTNYTHCATGCGSTLREAFEATLEDLAQQDINTDTIEVSAEAQFDEGSLTQLLLADLTSQVKEPGMIDTDIVQAYCDVQGRHLIAKITESEDDELDDAPDCAVCAGEWHFYVSIDVTVEG